MPKRLRMPKELTLDYSKWVHGNTKTKGIAKLLNEYDNMCCLGQFSEQCKVPLEALDHHSTPSDTCIHIPFLCTRDAYDDTENTQLSRNAMQINDKRHRHGVAEKVQELRQLFARIGRKIRLVNFPKKVVDKVGEV